MTRYYRILLCVLLFPVACDRSSDRSETRGSNEQAQHSPAPITKNDDPSMRNSGRNVDFLGCWKTKGSCNVVAVEGRYAFINDDSILTILDVSNHKSMTIVSAVWIGNEINALSLQGSYLYLVSGRSDLQIIDIGSPEHPELVSTFHVSGDMPIFGLSVSGDYAYLANGGLTVVDIHNKGAPVQVSAVNMDRSFWIDLDIDGNCAYLADNWGDAAFWAKDGLKIMDIEYPNSPSEVSFTKLLGKRVAVAEGVAYIIYADQLTLCDVSSPRYPGIIGTYLFDADESGNRAPDRRHPISPHFTEVLNHVVSGGILYAAVHSLGVSALRILDVRDPRSPMELGFFEVENPLDVYVDNEVAYLATGEDGLWS